MVAYASMKVHFEDYIRAALKEDITSEDITTNAIVSPEKQGCVQLICKQTGVIAGLDIFRHVFELLDPQARFDTEYKDGDFLQNGTMVGIVYGNVRALLTGERTALNFLQRMSGIASYTNECVQVMKLYKTQLLDTRKTTPNLRIFEKYAVKVGGGNNHRYNLSDGILIKDNHIGAAGGIAEAVRLAKEYAPFVRKIEVEAETLEMVDEALQAGADIIMLDNMDNETLKKAVDRIGSKAQTECSGNVTKERLKELCEIGVDYISSGALTHSAPILDFSLKNLKSLN
ncbi:putative nicotinate-nucleotide pyrophosphorylase [Anaerotignum neopropionicum]|uniref:Probable nicotinate-nucleotide pyrophosphorylase [carboxylating] n=1 Tax=Anaerotignum neopropionicum TaxID=36847 RepID=A0A136WEJ9_9FIRM|nr:carboxylating nicotinate-nucleotide diphosphorylase [Anaerotignum neopropionicum]KXL52779.1 putative nicotinate-nucleotide pyrophosphorylase [Anaerotignum neopropionicum]